MTSCRRSPSSSAARAATASPASARLDAAGLRAIEPHATGVAALHSPATGIVDFGAVCAQLAADLRAAGGELRFDWEVASSATGARHDPPAREPTATRSPGGAPSSAPGCGPTASRFARAPARTRGSFPSAARTCACARSGASSCAA